MQAHADTFDLNPPHGGLWRGPVGLALLVHALLLLALTWGVSWQRDRLVVAEAELWSALPQAAAPRAVEPEPPPAPPTPPEPSPPVRPAPPVPAPAANDAQIALQQKRQQERERQARLQEEKAAAEKAARDKAAAEKAARAKAAQEQAAREKAAQAQAARQQAQLEAERQKNLERMLGQAGATGGPAATGSAERASGPSASYAGVLVARIRPNIVFTELLSGNPVATVEVRALPDGTVLGSKLLKSSGVAAWDTAVLRAIERTGRLPRDENGRVPSTLILDFRPRD